MPRCAECLHYNFIVGFCPVGEGRRAEEACEKFQRRARKNLHEEFLNQMLHYNQPRWYFKKREEERKQVEAPKKQDITNRATVNPKKRKPAEEKGKATGNQLPAKKLNRQAPPKNRLPQSPNLKANQKPWEACEGPLSRFFTERPEQSLRSLPSTPVEEAKKSKSVFEILSRTD